MKFKIVLEPSDEGGFTAYVPSLPGCISEGDTREEAMKNIREASVFISSNCLKIGLRDIAIMDIFQGK